jgi:bifunctional non-homologous end joining protein LigD
MPLLIQFDRNEKVATFSRAEMPNYRNVWFQWTLGSAKRIAHKGIWVEPQLAAEIEYRAKSAQGKVRHPFFKGLRDDL